MPEGMTQQDRHWHKIYGRLPKRAKDAVKDGYNHIASEFFDHGFAACEDDRAETLVAAITRFLVECNDGVKLSPDPNDEDIDEIEYDEAGNTYSG